MSVAALAVAVAIGGPAYADARKACAESYVNAQKLRRDGALTRAREELLVCSRDECIAAVKKDCVDWLGEVSGAIPSIVIVARDGAGNETLDVRVTIDGKLAAERLSVSGIELDPGTHTIKLETAGAPSVERQVIVRQGEKNKVIEVGFATAEAARPATSPTPMATVATTSEPPRSPPIVSYVLGGVGVVSLGVAGAFWIGAESSRSDLDDARCAPRCNPDDVSAIERDRLIGDIALGVGLASLGAAVATYFLLRPSAQPLKTSRPPPLPVPARSAGQVMTLRAKGFTGRSGAWEVRF